MNEVLIKKNKRKFRNCCSILKQSITTLWSTSLKMALYQLHFNLIAILEFKYKKIIRWCRLIFIYTKVERGINDHVISFW